jgi:DNA-binding SARP family transcriptional activator
MEGRWQIGLLGGLRAERNGQVVTHFESRQVRSLLGYLAYHLDRAHPREGLLELLWPEEDPEVTRVRLRTVLARLRHALEPADVPAGSVLVADRDSVRLNPQVLTTDVLLFEAARRRAREATAPGDRVTLLAQAADLYRGTMLPGFYEEWIGPERERLADAYLETLAELAEHRALAGDLGGAVADARRAVAADPFRESSHRLLMRLYARAGRRPDAMRQYRELERILRDERGTVPSPETQALAREIESGGVEEWRSGRVDDPARGCPASTPPLFHSSTPPPELEPVGGAVPLDSPFYVERATDAGFRRAILRQDSIVLVKGPRQVGKTSLLARGLQEAREAGARVVLTDFQKLTAAELESAETLFVSLAAAIAEELELDFSVKALWNPERAWSANFERFLRREVLGAPAKSGGVEEWRSGRNDAEPSGSSSSARPLLHSSTPALVWGLDEVDRLFAHPFASEVFGLFRSWHNERALRPVVPWRQLTLAITYATEAHLFITDLNQSPFNVGTRLELEDFTLEQVADLNRRYGPYAGAGCPPLKDEAEVERYFRLVGGHPYLVRCGLHRMVGDGVGLEAIEAEATLDRGPFGEHLRRLRHSLSQDPELLAALREALERGACPTDESFYRLRSAGVLLGDTAAAVRPRCQLYRLYLEAPGR